MWWWLWIVWFFLLFWLVVMPFGWGYRRWGLPYYRPRRGYRSDLDPRYNTYDRADTDTGWGWWSFVIWLILIALIIWLIVAIWT